MGQQVQLRLRGHLTLTSIIQQPHTNTSTSGRRGAPCSAGAEWSPHAYNRAVANGPVGPAMAGPIIEPVFFFFPAGPVIEPVILIFAFFLMLSRHKRFSPVLNGSIIEPANK